MSGQLFSDVWYRVAGLRPKMVAHAELRPHDYRGQRYFVIEDQASGRVHRFTPIADYFIGLMDGRRTVDQIWEATENRFGDEAPTQDEAIHLLAQLHEAELLRMDVSPDCSELFRRFEARNRHDWRKRWANPLAIRVPLIDPDRFLDRHVSKIRWVFTRAGFLIWSVAVCTAFVLAAANWPALTNNVVDRVLTPQNLLLVWLTYPCIKLLHELGHAFAAKRWGCEVHTLGILFLVMMPMPYVDASSSSALPERSKRAFVAGMGVMVELFLAAIALFVWLSVEPGIVRAIAFNVVLIGSLSTLIFNGNPLLRFDGYFVLSDLLDVANLASRSNQYIGYLVQKYLFGMQSQQSPAASSGEAAWLAAYSVTSFAYRMFILFTIIILIAGKFFTIGVLIACWACATQVVWPILKKMNYLALSPQLNAHRFRAVGVTLMAFIVAALLIFKVPVPLRATTEGVVWAPAEAEVRADAGAIVASLVAEPGSDVNAGDVLLETRNPTLATRVDALAAELRGAEVRYRVALNDNQVEAEQIREEIKTLQANLDYARDRHDGLIVRSPVDGIFLLERPDDLVGRYVEQGELLGLVADLSHANIRVAVTQDDIGLIRSGARDIQVRLSDQIHRVFAARITRESPAATFTLPSPVLGIQGGGRLAVSPEDETGTTTLENVFHLELVVDQPVDRLGQRAHIRFDFGTEAIGWQWYRRLRQLFLRQLDA